MTDRREGTVEVSSGGSWGAELSLFVARSFESANQAMEYIEVNNSRGCERRCVMHSVDIVIK
jgi:hypothetical protein